MFESCDSTPNPVGNLHTAALFYVNQGFSIIPVRGAGDCEHPKRAAIPWTSYQHRRARTEEIRRWFANGRAGGLAIVCGRVSRLLVLDFDDAGVASEFRRLHPDLARTFTVRSGGRGLPHLYFRLPAGRLVRSQQAPGVDVRAEGSYVVAPPTCCGERAWTVAQDLPVLELTERDLTVIQEFVAVLEPDGSIRRAGGHPGAIHDYVEWAGPGCDPHTGLASDILIQRYLELVPRGRNRALFQVAVLARDEGWQEAAVAVVLASVHARQPGLTDEPFQERLKEAIRTIASAFSRPRRRHLQNLSGPVSRLSNSLREALLKRGLVAGARLLDALYLAGLRAGQWFSEKRACELVVAFGLGRRTVMNALKAVLQDGQRLFNLITPRTPRKAAGAATNTDNAENSCFMSTGADRVKNGRPPRLYALPQAEELADRLGVKMGGGDPVGPADLENPARYRLALHRELLRRRPGQYPRRWLAGRLGISIWTTRRYEARVGIQAQPVYASQPLRFANVRSYLPVTKEELPRGVMLESEGRRYPALRPIALRLLAQGKAVFWKRREPNYYCDADAARRVVPDVELPLVRAQGAIVRSGIGGVGIPTLTQLAPIGYPMGSNERHFEGCHWHPLAHEVIGASWIRTGIIPGSNHQETDAGSAQWDVPDSDRLIRQAHNQVRGLSKRIVRQLISQYGARALHHALDTLKVRKGIRNPAGFVIAFVRSEHNILCNHNSFSKAGTGRQQERAGEDWLSRMTGSAYLDFLANADDIRRIAIGNCS